MLPADTFAEGPPSGAAVAIPTNGRATPFPSQPVQGFSAVLDAGGGSYWAMPDSGYGGEPAASADFLLRMYRIKPTFKTASGGSGDVLVETFIELSDPGSKVPFPLQRPDRRLTGADFDIESVRRAADGSLWFGDEYGPFLLHTDSDGKLLDAPINPPPGVMGQDNPIRGDQPVTATRSRGFEGMGLSTDGPCGTGAGPEVVYPTLERQLVGEANPRVRRIYAYSLDEGRYTEQGLYAAESQGHAIGDVTNVDQNRLLVVERDSQEGAAAAFKRVYLVDLRVLDANGYLVKQQVADLLAIEDPAGVSLPERHPGDFGLGNPFKFPFATVEALLPLDRERLLVLNDNNYPYGKGRNPDFIDDNESIVVRIDALCGGLDRVGPTATTFRATPARFRVSTRSVAREDAPPRGTVFRFVLSERGRVKIRLDRVLPDRPSARFRRVGVLSPRALSRRGSIRFSGRLGRRVLKPGRYRATITATDAAGNTGRSRAVAFRIRR